MTRAVADAAARWRDPAFPPRVRALAGVASRTGYSIPVVTYAFDRLFESVTLDALESTIAREIGGRRTEPLGRVAVISSRTTIGVAIVPAIFALCAGCDVLVKDREDDLVRSFFQTLDDNVTFEAQAWEGPSRDLSPFDAVVAFGGDDALRAIRAQLAPTARFIPYGPKASIGYIVREALRDDIASRQIADGAARDLVLYDGEGCLSLHVLFVERGGSIEPERFAEILAAAVVDAERAFPIGTRDPAAAA
ncbi:MAG TPA: acyl-CoA reductase, partial [Candidatus Tyrphobacter sp.]